MISARLLALTQASGLVGNFSNEKKQMNDRKLEEARRLFEQTKPVPTMSEYEIEQQRIRENHQRLKAERLARETAASK
jgi:hypothetical protein